MIQKALTHALDFNSKEHSDKLTNIVSKETQIEEMKKRMIFRGSSGDNIGILSEFFSENIPFI